MNLVSNKLAARNGVRQLDALARCDAAGYRADAAVAALWKRLTALLAREAKRRRTQLTTPHEFTRQVADLLRRMHAAARDSLHGDFLDLARWGHASAADTLARTLPLAYLRSAAGATSAAGSRPPGLSPPARPLAESRLPGPPADLARDFPDVQQTSGFDCGGAAFRAVCLHFDVGPHGERDFLRLLQVDPAIGARTQDMLRVGRALGLAVRELRGRRSLIAFVQAGWPIIVPFQTAPDSGGADHYVTVIGVARRGVLIQDPAKGRRSLPWRAFVLAWQDWAERDDGVLRQQYGIAFRKPRTGLARTKLMEDEPGAGHDPGAIWLRLGLGGKLQATDRLGRLREPARDELPEEEQRELFARLLFPPPSLEQTLAILRRPVAGGTWEQDLSQATRLADPNVLAGIVAGGFAAGQTPAQVAKLLRPAVQEVKSTARRVARTHGMQIAHRAQMDAHAAVDDLIVGYQAHALLDQHTRSWHASRSGTIYYKDPGPGQKGMRQCPHPPLEAEDSGERPPGTPKTAWS